MIYETANGYSEEFALSLSGVHGHSKNHSKSSKKLAQQSNEELKGPF